MALEVGPLVLVFQPIKFIYRDTFLGLRMIYLNFLPTNRQQIYPSLSCQIKNYPETIQSWSVDIVPY